VPRRTLTIVGALLAFVAAATAAVVLGTADDRNPAVPRIVVENATLTPADSGGRALPVPPTAAQGASSLGAAIDDGSPAAAPPAGGSTLGPAMIVRRHLLQLGTGEYARAFALMSPAYRRHNPGWPSLRAFGAPAIRITAVGTPAVYGAEADVPVTFYARDLRPVEGSDTKCRRFSGVAHVVRIAGRWRYDPRTGALRAVVLPASDSRCP
jgi:hypothetical protein